MNLALIRYSVVKRYDATMSNMNAQNDAIFAQNRVTPVRPRTSSFEWIF
jgi:hypothetical protein